MQEVFCSIGVSRSIELSEYQLTDLKNWTEILESFRVEDFEMKYRSPNRFRFMGRGITMREESGGDLSYYMER